MNIQIGDIVGSNYHPGSDNDIQEGTIIHIQKIGSDPKYWIYYIQFPNNRRGWTWEYLDRGYREDLQGTRNCWQVCLGNIKYVRPAVITKEAISRELLRSGTIDRYS